MSIETVVSDIRQAPWASLRPEEEVEELVATVQRGDVASAVEWISSEIDMHLVCGNYIKGDVLVALRRKVQRLGRH